MQNKRENSHIKIKQGRMAEEIRCGLKKRKISQKTFCKSLLSYYEEELDEEEVEKHLERFKKVLSGTTKGIEMIPLYYSFYKMKYCNVHQISECSMKAAYQLFIQLDSRIISIELKDGCNKEAISSLYELFKKWRTVAEENGYKSIQFYQHSKQFMNQILRPFLSKWHVKEDIDSTKFRNELCLLQQEALKYITRLQKDFYIGR